MVTARLRHSLMRSRHVRGEITTWTPACSTARLRSRTKGSKGSVVVLWRTWRRLSRDSFASDLAASELCTNLDVLTNSSVDDLVKLYGVVLTDLLDCHCPVVKVRRRARQRRPWFDADCRSVRRRARAPERRFRRSRSDVFCCFWSTKTCWIYLPRRE